MQMHHVMKQNKFNEKVVDDHKKSSANFEGTYEDKYELGNLKMEF